ncbi:phosphatidylserine decarboxylase proenzyme, mitochondrial-like isoform X2 [Brevipalpus obovatus]|uniref:phosphatidylserine decarboxylase proenzyme, mitochondrial-like isoform X2 n=1 Tax=Brevipalpus obovatus TaxID=246614 RepID=UPI003D9F5CE2
MIIVCMVVAILSKKERIKKTIKAIIIIISSSKMMLIIRRKVSPVDGRILHFGEVKNGLIEQVKGVNFSLPAFLGPQTWWANHHSQQQHHHKCQDQQQQQQHQSTPRFNNLQAYVNNIIQSNSDNCLYCCVIYLAPNDYHRFHSPAQWNVHFRRHFPGQLLSVRPSFVERIKGLFAINERVCYYGSYEHGFFSMTAVGATNVGSVTTYFDRDLKTNKPEWGNEWSRRNDHFFEASPHFEKGDAFGEFNLGSTIVLVFEAPKNCKSMVQIGDKIKFGEPLFVPSPVGKSRHNRKISQSSKQI